MSTLRISNIEAKADSSSPTVDEQLRFTNSDGDLMLYLDGRTAGITTVGINTTNQTIKFDANNNVMVTGIITATEFHGSLAVGTSVTYGDNEKAYFGTGLDLELFHNGTNSVINNTEGALLFQNNGSSSMYIGSNGQVYLNNDITFVGASANALWDKSENYFSIPDKIVHSGDEILQSDFLVLIQFHLKLVVVKDYRYRVVEMLLQVVKTQSWELMTLIPSELDSLKKQDYILVLLLLIMLR